VRISLKAARINKNLTQEQVADELNVTKKTVGSWEKGKTRPKLEKIEPLCALYGVTYDDIAWNV
jgi:transcriptional regulator with XRE-family HTH domain